MRRLTCYEWIILALCAAFLLCCIGWLHLQRGTSHWQIETEHSAVSAPAPILSDPTDGLLEGEVINLNTASRSDLLRLPNIGPSRADAILAYRQAHSTFQSVDELLNVSGIGPAILDTLRPYLSAE